MTLTFILGEFMYGYFMISIPGIILILFLLHSYLKKKGKEKSLFFYSGLFYILMGLPIIYSWFIYIAIGFILIGIVLIFLSRLKIPIAVQAVSAPAPVLLLIFFIWYSESSKNIFLIPKGFTGRVVIVHGCKDGKEREYEGTYRVYRIGSDGLLKTKFSFAGSSFDSLHSRYYYIDADGNREPIEDRESDKVHPQGLWTLPYERKGETIIDFILDTKQSDPPGYRKEDNHRFQNAISSCAE